KAHGTHQRIEGEIPEGSLVLLIEDVTTSGGSVSEAVEVLRNAGGRVDRVLVVVDREEGARDRLASLGVRLESLATLAELRGPSP
ncbi:MAG TPA: phosphoribosyltransferase family protein, partial [Thermoplasmata archaeon]|nr:phosphoribosyltransferase family protein [Thermoplasmata archaeon]